ncbi:MAG: SPOR domain-containing protein [Dysgonomonas sp.]
MKLFFRTALLLAIFFFTFSCKTKQDQVMKEHYNTVNKYSTLENKLLRDNKNLLLSTSTTKNSNRNYDNSVDLQMYQSQVNSSEYKVLYDDSEIVNGDVYKEAAIHRQILIDRANNKNNSSTNSKTTVNSNNASSATAPTPTASVNATASTTTKANTPAKPVASSNTKETVNAKKNSTVAAKGAKTTEVSVPEFFAILTDIDKKDTQKVGISHLDDADRLLLKDYSVIIASFSQQEKIDPLKKALTSSVDKLFFVKSNAGFYYAIFGSYKTESEALQKIKRIRMEYTNLYTAEQLNDKYGIAFTDLYILKR